MSRLRSAMTSIWRNAFLAVLLPTTAVDTPFSCAEIELNHWPKPNGGEHVCPIFRGTDGEIRDYWWHDGPWRLKQERGTVIFMGTKGDRKFEVWSPTLRRTHWGVDREAWEAAHQLPRSQRNGFGLHSQPREKPSHTGEDATRPRETTASRPR